MVPNTAQTYEELDFEATTDADQVYASTQEAANCIALELAEDIVKDEICANTLPVADPQELVTPYDTPLDIVLTGSSITGDFLFFTILTSPSHGLLSGEGANWTYTPTPGYAGDDSFTFSVNDGTNESLPATISITVGFAAISQSIEVNYELDFPIILSVEGIDPDSVTYTILSLPTNGTLTGAGRSYIYTPDVGYDGPDSFQFDASDGTYTSDPATVSITVLPEGSFRADFITLQYRFTDGLDLDTRTSITAPEEGFEVGWCQPPFFVGSNGQVWYEWAGDNTGTGFESVLFYINAIRPDYPSATLLGACQAWWYNERVSGDTQLTLKAYQGGEMIFVEGEFRWENVGGVEVASLVYDGNVTLQDGTCVEDPECVTNFSYDLSTNIFTWIPC